LRIGQCLDLDVFPNKCFYTGSVDFHRTPPRPRCRRGVRGNRWPGAWAPSLVSWHAGRGSLADATGDAAARGEQRGFGLPIRRARGRHTGASHGVEHAGGRQRGSVPRQHGAHQRSYGFPLSCRLPRPPSAQTVWCPSPLRPVRTSGSLWTKKSGRDGLKQLLVSHQKKNGHCLSKASGLMAPRPRVRNPLSCLPDRLLVGHPLFFQALRSSGARCVARS
jgi:hypothetical protein